MSSIKRILPFLILNIILSASATLVVLYLWGGNTQQQTGESIPTLSAVLLPTSPPAGANQPPVETASAEKRIQIQDVQGPGDLNNEMVMLSRLGEGDLRLSGWRLQDQAGHTFTFPELVLNKGGSVRVYTRTGQNSVLNLFWGLNEVIWKPGVTVILLDAQGNQQATFLVK